MIVKEKGELQNLVDKTDQTVATVIPSPVILFPQGRLRLTLYQPEYLTLLADCLKNDQPFILSFQSDCHTIKQGISVSLVNFDLDNNQYLTIDVQGEYLVSLSKIEKNENGLRYAEAQALPHWTTINSDNRGNGHLDKSLPILVKSLQKLFEKKIEVSALYSQKQFQSIEWVCARLLELTPMPFQAKRHFLADDSFDAAIECLTIIFKEN